MNNDWKKGFTLAELLIVVAIIAVLAVVSIPVYNAQLEKSREAVDAANIRTQYAVIMTKIVESSGDVNKNGEDEELGKVRLKQKADGWQSTNVEDSLRSILSIKPGTNPAAQASAWVEYLAEDDRVYLCYGNEAGEELSGNVDWSSKALQTVGQRMIKQLTSTPGINYHILYSSNSSEFTVEQKTIVSEIAKYISLDKDYAVYYDWTGYPGIQCTVTTSVSKEGETGPFEYADRITFDKNGNVLLVKREYGAWQYNNHWGFHANDTVYGKKYPTEILYEKK